MVLLNPCWAIGKTMSVTSNNIDKNSTILYIDDNVEYQLAIIEDIDIPLVSTLCLLPILNGLWTSRIDRKEIKLRIAPQEIGYYYENKIDTNTIR